MKIMTTTCLATLGLVAAGPLWAEATDDGAAALLSLFQTYLGTTDGVVTVAPNGDAYAVTLDIAPLMGLVPVEGMTSTISALQMAVTDNEDGTWSYEIDQPMTIAYSMPGQMTTSSDYGSVTVNGVFDEALGDTSEYQVEITGISTVQTQNDPTMGEVSIKSTVDSVTYDGVAVAGETGIDSSFTATITGIGYDMMIPMGEGMPPTALSGTIANGTAEGAITGYQPAAIYGLVAWFVARPDQTMIMADKADLKAKLEAALPVFGNLAMTSAYNDVSVKTPLGVFGLQRMGIDVDLNGAVPDGLFREAFSLKGLTLPDGVAPPFATALIPDEFAIDVAVSSFDLDAAAKLALSMLDLPEGAEVPEGFDMQLLAALMPQGAVDISLAPGGAKNDIYALTYEGEMSAGMGGIPTGTAKVTLAGIDGIMAALAEAPPDMSGQIIPMIGMAQAMGQPGPSGELVWDIDASTPGSLKINGMDMMGGQ